MAKRKRARYTDKFRATAIVTLEAQGYPDNKGALIEVARRLKIPHQTLSRWAREVQNPAPPDVVLEKRADLKQLLRAEIEAALQAAQSARGDAYYKDLITGAAIMIDKLQLLEGLPTDRQDVTIHHLSDTERAERLTELLDAARARRDGRAADGDYLQ